MLAWLEAQLEKTAEASVFFEAVKSAHVWESLSRAQLAQLVFQLVLRAEMALRFLWELLYFPMRAGPVLV